MSIPAFRIAVVLMAVLVVVLSAAAWSAVKPNGLISDNAVLQQGIRVPIWGKADVGEKVTVKFQDQEVSTVATSGHWMVKLNPLRPGGPYTLKINDLEFKNILVGEVWVCSGQSNMWWTVELSDNAKAVIEGSKDPMLRLYTVPAASRPQELPQAWKECGPDTVPKFTAVGYFFGNELRKNLKVPVGLIYTAVGGTPAEAWTSRSALLADPELKGLVEKPWTRVSYLYNGMIAPLQPYGIAGAIWYQGESNSTHAYQYRKLFPAMIQNWRNAWGQGDFPFFFVQLAPFGVTNDYRKEYTWAEVRESQLITAQTLPKAGMAVITDYGDCADIHPKKKEPVGYRLALAARAIAYGEKLVYSGPVYKSMKVDGRLAVLSFDSIGGGLVVKDAPLKGFTIAGEDQKFVPAQAAIEGDTVVVSSPDVPKPIAVRYGWENCPSLNLFSKEGLPATPFRTDNWTLITESVK